MTGTIYLSRLINRIQEKPDSLLFLSLAEEYRKREMMDEAIITLANGIVNKPGFTRAQAILGRWLLDANRFYESRDVITEALKHNPDDPDLLVILGKVLSKLGNFSEAAEAYRKAVTMNPENFTARNELHTFEKSLEPSDDKDFTGPKSPQKVEFPQEIRTEQQSVVFSEPHESIPRSSMPNVQDITDETDRLIAQGKLSDAVSICTEYLHADPDIRFIIERRDTLMARIDETRRTQERKIAKLTSFLEGFRKWHTNTAASVT